MNVKILKETTRKSMGPFGDVDVKNDDPKKDKKNKEALKSDQAGVNKCKKGVRQHSRDRQDKQKNDNIRIIQEYERKERERRERFEREAAEAERNQREEEFARWERERRKEKSKNSSSLSRHKPRKPPAGYKDPHEVCKQVLPTKVKEKKRQEMRALMNCIAFTPSQTNLRTTSEESQARSEEKKKATVDDMDTSSGSDSTSTSITDVTPRSSSSGCSSMSKQSMCVDKPEKAKLEETSVRKLTDENKLKRETELGGVRRGGCKNPDGDLGKSVGGQAEPEVRKLTEAELEEMKYMQDAFEDLDLDEETSDFASSIISGLSEERRAKCNRKNMTFTNEQLREIERVNLILLKKIMNHRKPKVKPAACPPPANSRTSAAINRSRMEEKIERENKILLKKLQSAKGTTGTLSRKNSQSRCY